MKAYTDYPFVDGDYSIKEIEVLAYDRDKYASVRTPDGTINQVKTGYITKDAGATKFFNRRVWHSLPERVFGPRPTRKQIATTHKRFYKKRVTYRVFWETSARKFTNLVDAIAFIKTINIDDCNLVRYSDLKTSWTSEPLLGIENGIPYRVRNTCGKDRNRCAIKYKRFKILL